MLTTGRLACVIPRQGTWFQEYEGYITEEDVVVANGALSLFNQKRQYTGSSPPGPHGPYSYTSGWVMSMHKVHSNKGYFEFQARFPVGAKVWPAIWLISEKLLWGPEWDIFEYFGTHCKEGSDVMGTHLLTRRYPNEVWSSSWLPRFDATYDAKAWHVYGFEWTDSHAKWFIDGREVHHLENTHGADWPDEEMYIVLNNGVQTNSPDKGTVFPNSLDVKFVRIFKMPAVVNTTTSSLH